MKKHLENRFKMSMGTSREAQKKRLSSLQFPSRMRSSSSYSGVPSVEEETIIDGENIMSLQIHI